MGRGSVGGKMRGRVGRGEERRGRVGRGEERESGERRGNEEARGRKGGGGDIMGPTSHNRPHPTPAPPQRASTQDLLHRIATPTPTPRAWLARSVHSCKAPHSATTTSCTLATLLGTAVSVTGRSTAAGGAWPMMVVGVGGGRQSTLLRTLRAADWSAAADPSRCGLFCCCGSLTLRTGLLLRIPHAADCSAAADPSRRGLF